MATKAGVWIDYKQAKIVLLSDAGHEVKKILFDIGQPIRKAGSGRSTNKHRPNDFVAEDKLERKLANDRKDYYGNVLTALRGVSSVLILGPGEAKGEFSKQIQAKKVRGLAVELKTADKMTDRQLAKMVSDHFAAAKVGKAKKPTISKAKVPKKAVKVVAAKRTKKVRK